jgi:pilus assembly protein Flp/PilA
MAPHPRAHPRSGDYLILERTKMSRVSKLVRRLGKDEEGAALIEYTVLLGILVVAVIATIIAVGVWVNGKWTALQGQLS